MCWVISYLLFIALSGRASGGVVVAVVGLWVLVTTGWVLLEKNQGLWHLVWLFVPLGALMILYLGNRSDEVEASEESSDEIPWEAFAKMAGGERRLERTREEDEAGEDGEGLA